MGLTEQLSDLKRQMGREIPREILVEIGEFIKELGRSDLVETCCHAGDTMPGFSLPGVSGRQVSSERARMVFKELADEEAHHLEKLASIFEKSL